MGGGLFSSAIVSIHITSESCGPCKFQELPGTHWASLPRGCFNSEEGTTKLGFRDHVEGHRGFCTRRHVLGNLGS